MIIIKETGGNMVNIEKWHSNIVVQRVVNSLRNNGFHSIYVDTKDEAINFIMYHIDVGTVVSVGVSKTIEELDINRIIIEKGGTLLNFNQCFDSKEQMAIMRKQLLSDVYISSSNAVTLDGELINVDGIGNTVAALTFGPKKIILVVGINKIVKNQTQAFEKLKFSTCPKKNVILKTDNLCVKNGICEDCDKETRICRIYSIIKRKPFNSDYSVILVGENLGV